MTITGRTRLCAVIGDPVEHSLSPCIHNAAFKHLGLDYVYVAFRVRYEELEWAMQGVRSLGIRGLNVTMPHKIGVIRYLDHLDPEAELLGAVNTILNDDGALVGYNTDGRGALKALLEVDGDLKAKKVLIIGAGGASRALSFTLAPRVRELTILNRTYGRAKTLAEDLKKKVEGTVRACRLSDETLKEELENSDVVINATPVGMRPNEDETPIPKELLRPDLTVFDLVYNPIETRLLKEAKAVGAKTIDGLTMLVYQGAASFELWTGVEAPVEVMMDAVKRELRRRGITL